VRYQAQRCEFDNALFFAVVIKNPAPPPTTQTITLYPSHFNKPKPKQQPYENPGSRRWRTSHVDVAVGLFALKESLRVPSPAM
jgi:hypothetical protein